MRKRKGLWLDSSRCSPVGENRAVRTCRTATGTDDQQLVLRVTVYYSGRVQGVGFRYSVKRLVCGYEVSGSVQNLANGQVKLVAEGEKDELDAFLEAVGDSGLGPMIRGIDVHWSESTGEFRGFDIVR